MVLAWTTADIRYKFRVSVAPFPLQKFAFMAIITVGALTLLTDLWLQQHWLVPKADFLSPAIWQAILGAIFLFTFVIWTLFAFIRPPSYGKRNAQRFIQALYKIILKGSPSELAIIADELSASVRALVQFAPDWNQLPIRQRSQNDPRLPNLPKVEACANDILHLLADKKFCSAAIASAPGTILALYSEISKTKKYGIAISVFSRNIVSEAIENTDSFLFHETQGYESGLIGHIRPVSQAMFSDYRMVEKIGTLFDTDYSKRENWSATQWEAYCRAVLICFKNYASSALDQHSFALYRATCDIENATAGIYKLNGTPDDHWDRELSDKIRTAVNFIEEAVLILDETYINQDVTLRIHEMHSDSRSILDRLASMVFRIIQQASTVKTPAWTCWSTQHNHTWSDLYLSYKLDGPAGKIVRFKVRRLIYDEILKINKFPNFKGSKILGFCLNVMGFDARKEDESKRFHALQKAVISWTKKNYIWLHQKNSNVASDCLVVNISFDVENNRLVRTYPADGLRLEPRHFYLDLDPIKKSESKK